MGGLSAAEGAEGRRARSAQSYALGGRPAQGEGDGEEGPEFEPGGELAPFDADVGPHRVEFALDGGLGRDGRRLVWLGGHRALLYGGVGLVGWGVGTTARRAASRGTRLARLC